jgi:type I restriction enzyme, S subunit
MPAEWNLTTLGAIAPTPHGLVDGPFGSNLPASSYVPSGVPVIRGSNLSMGTRRFLDDGFVWVSDSTATQLARSMCRRGDIVFTKKGTLGQTGYIPQSALFDRYLLSSNQMKLSVDERFADSLFVYYYVSAPKSRDKIIQDASVTGVPKTNVAYLREFPILLPPLPTQRNIAAILSTYDDLIENNNRRIKLLEEMAQRIYNEWFVDFRYPGHEDVPLVDSELGPIPEGWKIQPFAALGKYVNGYAFKPGDWESDGTPIVKIRELKNGVTDETPRYAGNIGEKYVIHDGDLLFSWSADLDAYLWTGGQAWLNQHLFRVDPAPGIPSAFLFHALRERMTEFRSRAQGTTMRHIKRSALDQVTTVVAPASERNRLAELVAPVDQLNLELVRATRNLRASRDLLLPGLISGQIDVTDLDIVMPEVAA